MTADHSTTHGCPRCGAQFLEGFLTCDSYWANNTFEQSSLCHEREARNKAEAAAEEVKARLRRAEGDWNNASEFIQISQVVFGDSRPMTIEERGALDEFCWNELRGIPPRSDEREKGEEQLSADTNCLDGEAINSAL